MAADDRVGRAADDEWTDVLPSGPPIAGEPVRPATDTPPSFAPRQAAAGTSPAAPAGRVADSHAPGGALADSRIVGANVAVAVIAMLASALLVLGTFLPWMHYDIETATPEPASMDFNGWDISQDAELFTVTALIAASIAVALLFVRHQTLALVLKLGIIVAGAVAIGVAILDIADVQQSFDIPGVSSSVRFGLYVIVFAAIALLASGAAVRWRDLDPA